MEQAYRLMLAAREEDVPELAAAEAAPVDDEDGAGQARGSKGCFRWLSVLRSMIFY